ncbi:aspartic proteinase CDR1-like [Actinidia eriantha]|uniref:aspartic proteinase CDR1-like n=1 Tax=Actinidia eriantha TaxID=165200 RepID=UPI002589491C|nr:aspartic proteinase CDR1-like [Actinidia eriantha]
MGTIVMNSHSLFSFAFAITISIIFFSTFSLTEANSTLGFSVDLIHRDSQSSPFYNSSLTHFERVSNALRRSQSRVHYFSAACMSSEPATSEVIAIGGVYVMNITLGTPPFNILAIADTGSDLIWTQCMPCTDCYKQTAPLFNPKSSSTYKDVPCSSSECQDFPRSSCSDNDTCEYSVLYGDRSHSHGVLATETLSLGSTNVPGIVFGCGFDNGGTFSGDGSGIVGLGGGPVSLISQMNSSIDGKFSYCLVPMSSQNSKSSQMHFGDNAIVSGLEVVSTPIISKSPSTFYSLTLEGITIGRQRVEFHSDSSSSPNAFGNIIIDSGTTLTYLRSDFYDQFEAAVKTTVKLQPTSDPLQMLNLCYRMGDNFAFPIITVHFTGADVKLNPINAFVKTSDDVACLAFAPANTIAIFGNLAQMNFLVGYDLIKRTVSFKPTEC